MGFENAHWNTQERDIGVVRDISIKSSVKHFEYQELLRKKWRAKLQTSFWYCINACTFKKLSAVLVFELAHKCYGRIRKDTEQNREDVMVPVQEKKWVQGIAKVAFLHTGKGCVTNRSNTSLW